ncbi:hypothetical protein MRB53_035827 [Persea americana]|uniref:Uncharacterized protein n=1 Tax=Persea americana TaxID=3435 RepID=A0ACC2K5U2_PERAE|nr:hypothetical protein MRB53_035827 [Persea americana]
MVGGKVKAAMGFQKTPPRPKPQSPSPSPKHFPSPSSEKPPLHKTIFSRSFGVYFPRSSSQVQPRPPDVADLLRLVDELQEKESRLKTEILGHKLLKETAAIVPFLESEICSKNAEIECSKQRIEGLEAENEMLRRDLEMLKESIGRERMENERKMKEMEDEIAELRRSVDRKEAESKEICSKSVEIEECSSSQRFEGIIEATKSNLLKNSKNEGESTDVASNQDEEKLEIRDLKVDDAEKEEMQQNRTEEEETSQVSVIAISSVNPSLPRIPKPPPKPSSSSSSCSVLYSACAETREVVKSRAALEMRTVTKLPPLPPPLLVVAGEGANIPPPPPPPPPARLSRSGASKVRRMPEVVELYHSLMRRDSKREAGAGSSDVPAAANARNMIGEIENRSAHLLAIKRDIETKGDFILFLIKEVQNAAFSDIEDVVTFVKWLDDELSFLVDERAVLKHFDWPELKADAMREAAFGYCDLKKLEYEASSFCDDIRRPCGPALKKMQALLEKLEHGVYNLSRMREAAMKRYKGFQIPWEWMLETGYVSQIKLASVKLAMKYMKRITAELEAVGAPEEEELMLQCVRFAFRVHQFAGGFDVETMRAFQELRSKSRSCHIQTQKQQQQKPLCQSTSC